jgi:SAM-dependent methyltransferase
MAREKGKGRPRRHRSRGALLSVSAAGRRRAGGGSLAGAVTAPLGELVGRLRKPVRPPPDAERVGFGPGVAIAELAERATAGRVAGVAASPVMLRQVRRRNAAAIRAGLVQLHMAPVEEPPEGLGGPFDKVLAVNTVGVWHGPGARLADLAGRMRPGGRVALVSQPRCPGTTGEATVAAGRDWLLICARPASASSASRPSTCGHWWSAFSGRANGVQVDPADDPRRSIHALPEPNRACRAGRRRCRVSRHAVGGGVPTSSPCPKPFTRGPYTRGVWGNE